MITFTQELRHYCRNPRCRMKLPQPITNPREAFCCRGCYQGFYRFRCLICEEPMERKSERKQICGKVKCNSALAAVEKEKGTAPLLGRWTTIKTPENKGLLKPTWRVVAAPPEGISANAFHCATVGTRTPKKFKSKRGIEWALRVNQRRIIGPRVVLARELP